MDIKFHDVIVAKEFKVTENDKLQKKTKRNRIPINKKHLIIALAFILCAPLAHASVESSLLGIKSVLLGSVLPICAVLGLGFAAFSFLTGNPNAKQHLGYAVTGAVILFGAQSIVDLLQRVVR